MKQAAVDRADPTPLHHQVRRALLALIRESRLRPGDQLPPENTLCDRFGVSRQTVRQAVEALVRDHVLYRQRPKGTFVGFGAVEGDLQVLRSVWEDLRRLGMEPAVRVLGVKTRPASEAAAFLEVAPDSDVIELRRLFLADGSPISYDCAYFPLPDFAWLLEEDLSASWYELLRAQGISILYARTIIGATLADNELAALLDAAPGAALLRLRRQTYAQDDHPVAYTCGLYKCDRYQFSVTLSRRPTAASGGELES
ncbi:MAG: GntR family transcriptional regulator [Acetobacteraceae bacterium]|nr:GntR family transcriptional regulator [Acetobacteraceae bacterium]MBV8588848.1 GntR family transcriptional regulator [Acetobacteraceae bacterium]